MQRAARTVARSRGRVAASLVLASALAQALPAQQPGLPPQQPGLSPQQPGLSPQQPGLSPQQPAAAAVAAQGPGLMPHGDVAQGNIGAGDAVASAAGTHPLEPALQVAQKGLAAIRANIRDYSATVVKRERIDGKLGEHEYMFAKIRQQPFSVYLYFLGPDSVKGQEVIYVDGVNDGNMLAHAGSGVRAMVGTVSLKPQSMLAMAGNRYPITELGVENLTRRLLEVAEHDKQFGECDVNFYPNAKVNGRICTCIQVTHPVPRRNFRFHLARVFIDDELTIPIRYEAYDWPQQAGGQPVLMEEYTYMNVKINNGFTDADFDPRNTAYKFGMK
jgi:outer membrane lipoprotein-sorting protein